MSNPLDDDRFAPHTPGGLDPLGVRKPGAGFDPGTKYSVPWATGTTGIGYDTTVFPEPPGYDVFLDEDQAGRMTILNESGTHSASRCSRLISIPTLRRPTTSAQPPIG